jgi:hypothetical protein
MAWQNGSERKTEDGRWKKEDGRKKRKEGI